MKAPESLGDLCRYILEYEEGRYVGDPVRLGAVFREFANIHRTPVLKRTVNLVRSLGIDIEAVDYLKSGGTSMRANGAWHIRYSAKEKPATQKFTIYHELFEIIQKSIGDMDPGFSVMTEPRLSQCADRFAASALIPPRFFASRASAAGCDLVALGDELELSHQCLLIALGQHFADIPLVGVLYENRHDGTDSTNDRVQDFVATVVVKTPQAKRARVLCGLQSVPARNSRPHAGSLVCAAITGGQSLLWRNAHTDELPVLLVRPLLSAGREPYRVMLLAVPADEFSMISSQVDLIHPITVNGEISCPFENKCLHSSNCIWRARGGYDEFGI
jgi:hypothetical protein